MNDDELLPPREAARSLGMHVNTLKRIPAAELPYYRLGSRGDRRYQRADLRLYLATRRVSA